MNGKIQIIEGMNLSDHILAYGTAQVIKSAGLFEQKEAEFKLALKEERMAEIRVAELRTETEVYADNINELNKKIKKSL